MTELSLNQLKLKEEQQPDYPLLRQPAACQQWGSQQTLLLAQSGCAYVQLLWRYDLMDLTDPSCAVDRVFAFWLVVSRCSTALAATDPDHV